MASTGQVSIRALILGDDGVFPNNPVYPLLLYSRAFLPFGTDPAGEVERRFNANDWPAAWRNGVYSIQHYHGHAHEVLGIYRGHARVQFGGPQGPVVEVTAGDAALLPAGTAHMLIEAAPDFAVVGAYPPGQYPDMCYGRPEERPKADRSIAAVPRPRTDPILGLTGGLLELWPEATKGC